MISHQAAQLALRTQLLTFPTLVTTGSTTLAGTTTGYSRTTGSFLTDGFFPGMEVTPTGFTATDPVTITSVAALTLTVHGSLTAESSASGRTLSVGLPAQRSWENVKFTPDAMVPYIRESYMPGPMRKFGVGAFGQLEIDPMYVIHVFVPSGFDVSAGNIYADGLLALFAPATSLTLANAAFWVRTDVAPYRGQALQLSTGFSAIPVNIPCRIHTANSI